MRLLPFILLIMTVVSSSVYADEYKPWNENVFVFVKEKYGDQAEKRMRALHKIVLNNQDKTDLEKLTITNNTMNLLPWISDQKKWKKVDYWATPFEVITTFGGDCEDITFAKWIMLRHLGVPNEQLYFAYVKIKHLKQAHMVLLYKETPNVPIDESKVYILDNMDPDVQLASKRPDLEGVYVFDTKGKIYLLNDDGGDRSISKILEPRHFKNLDALKKHFLKDREMLKKVNNGEYLLPDL